MACDPRHVSVTVSDTGPWPEGTVSIGGSCWAGALASQSLRSHGSVSDTGTGV
jgi:hypothetical protein